MKLNKGPYQKKCWSSALSCLSRGPTSGWEVPCSLLARGSLATPNEVPTTVVWESQILHLKLILTIRQGVAVARVQVDLVICVPQHVWWKRQWCQELIPPLVSYSSRAGTLQRNNPCKIKSFCQNKSKASPSAALHLVNQICYLQTQRWDGYFGMFRGGGQCLLKKRPAKQEVFSLKGEKWNVIWMIVRRQDINNCLWFFSVKTRGTSYND